MNRYEFESLISDYIEGELSFNKREEFEAYMGEDISAKTLLNDVKKTLNEMKNIKAVATSDDFNSKLLILSIFLILYLKFLSFISCSMFSSLRLFEL